MRSFSHYKEVIKDKLEIHGSCLDCGTPFILKNITSRTDKHYVINTHTRCRKCRMIKEDKNREIALQKESNKVDKFISMPYKEYLETDHWKKTRAKALKKANYKCELCNSTKELNVHHKTYGNRGKEKPEDLIVLCHNCHAKFHDKPVDNVIPIIEPGRPIAFTLKRIREIQVGIDESFKDFTELPLEIIEEYNKLITSKVF